MKKEVSKEIVCPNIELLYLYPYQVGGHGDILTDNCFVYKPTCKRELEFYKIIYGDESNSNYKDTICNGLKRMKLLVPFYHGFCEFNNKYYVILDDINPNGYDMNIIDIKIGLKNYMGSYNIKKLWRMVHKDYTTTTKSLGIRLSGMKYNKKVYSKAIVKLLSRNPKVLGMILARFFEDLTTEQRKYLAKTLLDMVEAIQNSHLNLYSSSLLIMTYPDKKKMPIIKLIDFAHYLLNTDDPYVPGPEIKAIKLLSSVLNKDLKL